MPKHLYSHNPDAAPDTDAGAKSEAGTHMPGNPGSDELERLRRDVAELQQRQKALSQSEAQFRALVEGSYDAMLVLTGEGQIAYQSPAVKRLYGFEPEELDGTSMMDHIHPDDLPRASELFSKLMNTPGGYVGYAFTVRTKDGSWRHIEGVGKNCLEDPNVRGIVVNCIDVTERHMAEERLRRSEEKYRSIVESSTDVIMLTASDGRIAYLSPASIKVLGYRAEDMIGKAAAALFPEGKPSHVLRRMLRGSKGSNLQHRVVTSHKRTKWVSHSWAPITTEDGVRMVLSVIRDITEQKKAENLLRESEERYRGLVEGALDVVLTVSLDGKITSLNPAFETITGWKSTDWIGKDLVLLVHEGDRDKLRSSIEEMGRGSSSALAMDVRVRSRWNDYIPLEVRASAQVYGGAVTNLVAVGRDMTERLKAQQENIRATKRKDAAYAVGRQANSSLELERMLQGMLGTLLDLVGAEVGGIYTFDYEAGQATLAAHKGLSPRFLEAIGTITVHDEELKKSLDWSQATVGIDDIYSGERAAELKRTVHDEGLAGLTIFPFWHRDLPLGAFFAASRKGQLSEDDIDILQSLGSTIAAGVKNAQLYEREKELRRKWETEVHKRVEFTRTLVHELKTPLTALMASSEILAHELPPGLLGSLASNLRRSALNLDARINELLDLARGELGMLRLRYSWFKPDESVASLMAEVSSLATVRKQRLKMEIAASLPLIWADEDRLRQIVLNLLNNALKFTPEGGVITLRAREEEGDLVVEVQDNGPGISEEDQKRLFNPYHRIETDREHLSGLGLGLALSKTLVELHGGCIWIHSRLDEGSTFGFRLPLRPAGAPSDEEQA